MKLIYSMTTKHFTVSEGPFYDASKTIAMPI